MFTSWFQPQSQRSEPLKQESWFVSLRPPSPVADRTECRGRRCYEPHVRDAELSRTWDKPTSDVGAHTTTLELMVARIRELGRSGRMANYPQQASDGSVFGELIESRA